MKRGAFAAGRAVVPTYLKFYNGSVNPAFDTIEFLPLLVIQLSWAGYRAEQFVLPEFRPNEYLYETHKDKGKERWEIFAWAVRDIMIKSGDFEECNFPIKTKFKYENYMQMKKGAELPSREQIDLEMQSLVAQDPRTDERYPSDTKRQETNSMDPLKASESNSSEKLSLEHVDVQIEK